MTKKTQTVKERGGLLSAWLILIMLHGLFFSYLLFYLRQQQGEDSPAWVLGILLLLALGKVVSAIAIWFWKRWGLVLYTVVVIAGMAIGLMLTGTQLIVFHDIIPFVITGFLVKDKRAYFD